MSRTDEVLRNVDAIFLDFDGPVCSVFAGYPASVIAGQMREILIAEGGYVDKSAIGDICDPLDLLRWTAENRPDLVSKADDFLCAAERQAVFRAAPTKRAHDTIIAARHAGRLVAIVSNNSREAINIYLGAYHLDTYVSCVTGRPYAEPHRMKPNPESILRTTTALGVLPAACVFVGDSVTDVEASRLAGTNFIGYAKHADRIPILSSAGAGVIVEDMGMIAHALEEL